MESKWDIVFAIKIDIINRHISSSKIQFMAPFEYKHERAEVKFKGGIPKFQIGWAGNEQYMALKLTLIDVEINFAGIVQTYSRIESLVHFQYEFKDRENVGFVCKSLATRYNDPSPGALWVENADIEKVIKESILQDAFVGLLGHALIENENKINFVIASLKQHFFELIGIRISKSVPAFQSLDGVNVMAVMCMTQPISDTPSRQFSPELLLNFDYGYIFRRSVFLREMVLPNIHSLLGVHSGSFKMLEDNAIVNDGEVIIKTIWVASTSYILRAYLLMLHFEGDILHLTLKGETDFTGLIDSTISYSFHAKRMAYFTNDNTQKIKFVKISGQNDEFHSQKYIPLWIEIIVGIFTFGLFNLISEIFCSEIQSRTENMLNSINYNGNNEGYSLRWANMNLKFTDGGFGHDFYMRGR